MSMRDQDYTRYWLNLLCLISGGPIPESAMVLRHSLLGHLMDNANKERDGGNGTVLTPHLSRPSLAG